ncbi:MAG: aminopeptidase [Candidatus Altiarchaeota archaeon]
MSSLKKTEDDRKTVEYLKEVLTKCLAIREGEKVLVVADTQSLEVAEYFLKASYALSSNSSIIVMEPRERNGQEPTKEVSEAMIRPDVELLLTSKSISHTDARRNALKSGARLASLPGLTKEMITSGGLTADYDIVKKITDKVAKEISGTSVVKIESKLGTNLTLEISGQKIYGDTGIYVKPRSWGNLPAGEVCLAPVEGVGEGLFVVDGSMIDSLNDTIEIEISEGRAVSIRGGKEAEKLEQVLEKSGSKAFMLAELGFGTNPQARLIGNVLEDEKVLGTIHIAFGNNISFGGTNDVPVHIDGVMKEPNIFFDKKLVMEKGKFLFEF